jgi:hypothetical protein
LNKSKNKVRSFNGLRRVDKHYRHAFRYNDAAFVAQTEAWCDTLRSVRQHQPICFYTNLLAKFKINYTVMLA